MASPARDEAYNLTRRSWPYRLHVSMDETLSGRPGLGGRPLFAASPLLRSDAESTRLHIDLLARSICEVGATHSHSCGNDLSLAADAQSAMHGCPELTWLVTRTMAPWGGWL